MSSSKLILALLALPVSAYRTSARPRLRGGVSETTSDVPKSASPAFDTDETRRLGAAIKRAALASALPPDAVRQAVNVASDPRIEGFKDQLSALKVILATANEKPFECPAPYR